MSVVAVDLTLLVKYVQSIAPCAYYGALFQPMLY